MPIIIPTKHTAPVFFPTSNHKIYRYLDITKFLSLLSRKSLFLSRLDKLEDHFEGTTAKINFEIRKQRYRKQHLISNKIKKLTEKEILDNVEKDYIADEKMKSLKCVSCWNIDESESAALWKIYADFKSGILITSSVESLIIALKDTKENISLSEVKYIDYNTGYMPDGNTMYPVIHKHRAYSFENELRLINTVDFEGGLVYDWAKEEVSHGKYIEIDIKSLINEIILSPYSPKWFFDLVQEQCTLHGLDIKIKKSELSKD